MADYKRIPTTERYEKRNELPRLGNAQLPPGVQSPRGNPGQQPDYPTFRRRNFTHTGVGTGVTARVGWSRPVRGSMRNVTMVSVSWFAASRNLPVGSMPKLRGVLALGGLVPNAG